MELNWHNRLREDAQSEIDHRIQEQTLQREAEEVVQGWKKRRFEALYNAWLPKFLEWQERKDEEKAEKQDKTLKFDSSTESDSEASEGYEYEVEEVDTSDLDSDAAEDNEEEREEGDEDSDDESSSSGTSLAPSDSEDYGEEGLDTDEDERWKKRERIERYERRWIKTRSATESESDEEGGEAVELDEDDSSSEGSNDPEKEARERQRQERDDAEMYLLYLTEKAQPWIFARTVSEPLNVVSDGEEIPGMDVDGNPIATEIKLGSSSSGRYFVGTCYGGYGNFAYRTASELVVQV
ncbi:uncharacterized protein LOC113311238 [Papaver somniferum]|uniref:uncharacterized protein LOC113311238 n=1 Tax=Papaver somniferum TaxID=3469 RepID=UPI000E6F621C|nr:uncharacterized protein LOC113311238 [Papaver somniferum]